MVQAKALAEEGLFDLVGEAWGDQTTELAHAYMEYALPHLPIDAHAFELAVEGKLQPGGELEAIYGKPAVEVGRVLRRVMSFFPGSIGVY